MKNEKIIDGKIIDGKKKLPNRKFLAIGLGAIAIGGVLATSVLAQNGFGKKGMFNQNEDLHLALVSGDYETFIEELSLIDSDFAKQIDEDAFNKISERAQEKNSFRDSFKKERKLGFDLRESNRDLVKVAIDNGDYEAWVKAVSSMGHGNNVKDIINEENFAEFVEFHKELDEGNLENAKIISDELGLNFQKNKLGNKMKMNNQLELGFNHCNK